MSDDVLSKAYYVVCRTCLISQSDYVAFSSNDKTECTNKIHELRKTLTHAERHFYHVKYETVTKEKLEFEVERKWVRV